MTGFSGQSTLDFDFAVGCVRGLRKWNMPGPTLDNDPTSAEKNWPSAPLRGATGYLWDRGVLEAVCNNGYRHQPPVDRDPNTGTACGCGYWAYWTTNALSSHGSMFTGGGASSLPVVGIIEGTGRVLIGENGFRSQRARIVALAPAFCITGEVAPWYPNPYNDPYRDPRRDPYLAFGKEHRGEEEHAELVRKATQQADAWMGVITDRLGVLYPDARVFATASGMLASVPVEGKP